VKARDLDRDDEIDLPPSEAARDRRRDRDLRAAEREGMRTGLAKQFKQVLDVQLRRGREARDESLLDEELSREPEPALRPGKHRAPVRPSDARQGRR
jgi:hypothetical protein